MKTNRIDSGTVHRPSTSERDIYEGGQLQQITSSDLIGNDVAIRQLLNNFNLKVRENEEKELVIRELTSDIEHLRTTPFMAIVSTLVNLLGTLVAGIGMEQLKDSKGMLLICIGGVLVLIGSISPILFPYAKGWFNKAPQEQ